MAKKEPLILYTMKNENSSMEETEGEVIGGSIVQIVKPKNEKIEDEKQPFIKRGRVDSLSIYEIREDELNTIEKGSNSSIYLNFSIFLISIGISFLIALLTSDYKDKILTFTIFCVVTGIGFIIGLFLLILWLREKDDFKDVIKNIKERMK
jgi:hypothetical protein